mmetsp:Transcript_48934/g.59012  ORF Transcript_48934/g.59012 Transcript_48934/m.59012 type:complete len:288 (-) Transcript_48934:220-1083(-)
MVYSNKNSSLLLVDRPSAKSQTNISENCPHISFFTPIPGQFDNAEEQKDVVLSAERKTHPCVPNENKSLQSNSKASGLDYITDAIFMIEGSNIRRCQSPSSAFSQTVISPKFHRNDRLIIDQHKGNQRCSTSYENGISSSEVIEGFRNNDVILGRGGRTNKHIGNRQFRALVSKFRSSYIVADKLDKSPIARFIVGNVRSLNPPGRFMKYDDFGQWYDVGNKRAVEKTTQALREGGVGVAAALLETTRINSNIMSCNDISACLRKRHCHTTSERRNNNSRRPLKKRR